MRQRETVVHEFVDLIPDALDEGKIYVSVEYATVVHKCCCGCGKEVVTPLSPTDWMLIFNGKAISLDPSIGNWSFPCRSHYWIRNNRVKWAEQWSQARIDANRAHDRWEKERYFSAGVSAADLSKPRQNPARLEPAQAEKGFWRKLKKFWSR